VNTKSCAIREKSYKRVHVSIQGRGFAKKTKNGERGGEQKGGGEGEEEITTAIPKPPNTTWREAGGGKKETPSMGKKGIRRRILEVRIFNTKKKRE